MSNDEKSEIQPDQPMRIVIQLEIETIINLMAFYLYFEKLYCFKIHN